MLADGLLIAPVSGLFALDPASGRAIWKAPDVASGYGASAVMSVGGTRVLVTPSGNVVRLKDGKVMAKEIGVAEYASVVAQGDTAYFVGGQSSAVRLSLKGPDEIQAKEIWNESWGGDFFASPVLTDGLLYAVNKDAVYSVVEMKTGKALRSEPLTLPPAGQPGEPSGRFIYPSVSLAGGRLYVGNTKGEWSVLEPGLKGVEVKRNTLPSGSPASPAFAGGQLFIRAGAELYCIQEK